VTSSVEALSVIEGVVSVRVFDAEGKLVAGRGIPDPASPEIVVRRRNISHAGEE
jgi:hypothetical protein